MVDNLIIGGGALSERMEHWLADKGVKAYKTYGMTETCSHIALSAVSRESLPYTAIGDVTFSVDGNASTHDGQEKVITYFVTARINPDMKISSLNMRRAASNENE